MSCTALAITGEPVLALIGLGGVLLATGAMLMLVTRNRRGQAAAAMTVLLVITGGLIAVSSEYSPVHAATFACARSGSPNASSDHPSGVGSRTNSPSTSPPSTSPTRTRPSPSVKPVSSTRPTGTSPTGTSPTGTSPTGTSPTSTSPPGDGALTIIQTSVMSGLGPGIAPTTITGTITNSGTSSTFVTTVTVAISDVVKATGAVAGTCDASDYVLSDPTMPVGQVLDPGQSADFTGAQIGFSDKAANQDACRSSVIRSAL